MAKKDINEKPQKKSAKPSSDGGTKRVKEAKPKQVSKEDLVGEMRKCKKGMQEARFGLSQEAQQKSGSRKQLRKQAAQAAMRLTLLRKQGVVRG